MNHQKEFAVVKGILILIVIVVSFFNELNNILLLGTKISVLGIVLLEIFIAYLIVLIIEYKIDNQKGASTLSSLLNTIFSYFLIIIILMIYVDNNSIIIFKMDFSFILVLFIFKVIERLAISYAYLNNHLPMKNTRVDLFFLIALSVFITSLLLEGFPFFYLGKIGRDIFLLFTSSSFILMILYSIIFDIVQFKKRIMA